MTESENLPTKKVDAVQEINNAIANPQLARVVLEKIASSASFRQTLGNQKSGK